MRRSAARHWILGAGAAVFAAAAVLLHALGRTRIGSSGDHTSGELWSLWLPVAAGMLLIRLLPWRAPDLTGALRTALAGRLPGREVTALIGCIAAFAAGDPVLEFLFGLVSPGLAMLSHHTAKVVFLLIVPMVLVGGNGVMRHASGTSLSYFAMHITEPWRWYGLFAAGGYLYLAVCTPWSTALPTPGRLPGQYTLLLALLLTFATTSLLEEAFFRGLLQTRLELLFGTWPGILSASLLYALSALVGAAHYGDPLVEAAMAVAVQGAAGLLFGYLWSRYRNMWVNFLLHIGVSSLVVPPLLEGTPL